ncbi:hypothetical protein KBD87_04840 [Candidatus Saccharibacteria bacterium]|jgi:hypothetical protein|nr:hypothetical protein [Candidatus Saccharibacteria bacterium]
MNGWLFAGIVVIIDIGAFILCVRHLDDVILFLEKRQYKKIRLDSLLRFFKSLFQKKPPPDYEALMVDWLNQGPSTTDTMIKAVFATFAKEYKRGISTPRIVFSNGMITVTANGISHTPKVSTFSKHAGGNWQKN